MIRRKIASLKCLKCPKVYGDLSPVFHGYHLFYLLSYYSFSSTGVGLGFRLVTRLLSLVTPVEVVYFYGSVALCVELKYARQLDF